MSNSKTLGNLTQTVANDYKVAITAISNIQKRLSSPRYSDEQKQKLIYKFEDIMNSLAGVISNSQDQDLIKTIQDGCAIVVQQVTELELVIFLNDSLLPKTVGQEVATRKLIAKKLYPKTETRQVTDVSFDPITGKSSVKDTDGTPINGGTSGLSGTGVSSVSPGSITKPKGSGAAGKPKQPGETASSQISAAAADAAADEQLTNVAKNINISDDIDAAAAVLSGLLDIDELDKLSDAASLGAEAGQNISDSVFQAGAAGINAINPTNIPTSTSLLSNQNIDSGAAKPSAITTTTPSPTAPDSIELSPEDISYSNPFFGTDISLADQEIDPNFDAMDAEMIASAQSYANTPATQIGEEHPSVLPKDLLEIISKFGENGNTFEEDLGNILFKNPIRDVILQSKSNLLYYSENNFANLNAAMPNVSANVAFTTEYNNLKSAIGGSDGLSGTVSYFDALLEHTDRISGLKVEDNNELASARDDSPTHDVVVNDITSGVDTIIASFSANKIRSAQYYIQASAGIEQQLTYLSVIHDGGIVYVRKNDLNYSIDPYVEYKCNVSNGIVNIIANSTIANTGFVLHGTRLKLGKEIEINPNMTHYKIVGNAKKINGYYQTDEDYITRQTSSMFIGPNVSAINDVISKMIGFVASPTFTNLSLSNQKDYINSQTNTINTNKIAMKNSIQSDMAEFDKINNRLAALEIAVLESGVYEDSNSRKILNLVLKDNVRESIQ